jgi:4-hydroxybenzoate polyprenyltransferase
VLTTNAATIAWSFAALAIAHRLSLCQALRLDAAGGAGRGLQLRHPDGVRRGAGRVPLLAWVLLLGNLFWVLAYDTEYAMVDRDDDLRIGIKTSAITLGRADVPVVMACYAAFLAVWGGRWRRVILGLPF